MTLSSQTKANVYRANNGFEVIDGIVTSAAKASDFAIGTELKDRHNTYTIIAFYDKGIWEARTTSGTKCVFECEANCYELISKGN